MLKGVRKVNEYESALQEIKNASKQAKKQPGLVLFSLFFYR